MAASGNQKEMITKNLYGTVCDEGAKSNFDDNHKKEHSSFALNKTDNVSANERNTDDLAYCMSDRTINEVIGNHFPEKNNDDINQSSDSLSSSASISDSDLTSTDSDDSLALSESESITDVTPLNSPYCDSPLPQNRHSDHKAEEKNISNTSRDIDNVIGDSHGPEVNVLMKAIEKIELETKDKAEFGFRENLIHRRATSFSLEETRKIELENQRLLKRVIYQQNRIKSIYPVPNQSASKILSYRHQELVKSDGDISETRKSLVAKYSKEGDKSNIHRRQKCLSHPSPFIYSCSNNIDKTVLTDGLFCENNKKKKTVSMSGMDRKSSSLTPKDSFEEVSSSSTEMN